MSHETVTFSDFLEQQQVRVIRRLAKVQRRANERRRTGIAAMDMDWVGTGGATGPKKPSLSQLDNEREG